MSTDGTAAEITPVLAGKVAIVTGGGRGLGRAMVLGLAQAGANVLATAARSFAQVEQVADEANQLAGERRVRSMTADVTREEDCLAVVKEALGRFGSVHILVNNAGRGMRYVSPTFLAQPTRFWEVEAPSWRMIVDTNINGPFLMAKAVVPHMLAQKWGRIVNISMNHDTMRRIGFSPYGPSKAALESETIIWAQDLADTGITVNALLPGCASNTGMIPDGVPDEVRRQLLDPGIMVPLLLWLASDASASMTGKRLVAARWDASLPAHEAAERACEHAGWAVFGP
jgi:NAD(P)-dependent dehydrogenase (short-subunit alcohol dehydrogenase family)